MTGRRRPQEWALRIDPDWSVRHVGKCLVCGEFCVDTASSGEAREWCVGHARATGDDHFELAAFEYISAISAEHPPSMNGTSPTKAGAGRSSRPHRCPALCRTTAEGRDHPASGEPVLDIACAGLRAAGRLEVTGSEAPRSLPHFGFPPCWTNGRLADVVRG
ncbi:DUF7848 domain-containing protein [Streptomyces noursei]|uniref:DUF7848 domain-containing protein n=1 Tax=Streptomyces noursei TaxID=1971 RepID=UPI00406BDA4D